MTTKYQMIASYMRDISGFSLVTPREEKELAKLIKKGDEKAKEKLITANLRLVVKIACAFEGLGLPLDELIAEGNIGLIRAVEKFDPGKGAKLSSYASWWIKQAIQRATHAKNNTIRVPISALVKSTRSERSNGN